MKRRTSAFTLLEILVSVAIVAALAAVLTFYITEYVIYARQQADRQTLTVLNDALSRYKTQGGGTSRLTAGSNISALLSRMKTATTWGGLGHQFLQTSYTYPARSLSAVGNGAQYNFYRANTYTDRTPGSSEATNTYPYGQGVGYMSTGGTYTFSFTNTTGYVAVQQTDGTVTICNGSANLSNAGASITFWSCAGAADPTPSGNITIFTCGDDFTSDNGAFLTSLNVQGLTSLTYLDCHNNTLTSLNVSGNKSLATLICSFNNLTAIDVSGLNSLTNFQCTNNLITSLTLSNLPALASFSATSNKIATLTLSNLPSLTTFTCRSNSTTLTSIVLSSTPLLASMDIRSNKLSAAALNTLYTALPDRTSLSLGDLKRTGNTGSGTDTTSIATTKNWNVH